MVRSAQGLSLISLKALDKFQDNFLFHNSLDAMSEQRQNLESKIKECLERFKISFEKQQVKNKLHIDKEKIEISSSVGDGDGDSFTIFERGFSGGWLFTESVLPRAFINIQLQPTAKTIKTSKAKRKFLEDSDDEDDEEILNSVDLGLKITVSSVAAENKVIEQQFLKLERLKEKEISQQKTSQQVKVAPPPSPSPSPPPLLPPPPPILKRKQHVKYLLKYVDSCCPPGIWNDCCWEKNSIFLRLQVTGDEATICAKGKESDKESWKTVDNSLLYECSRDGIVTDKRFK